MVRWLLAASMLVGCAGVTSPLSPSQTVLGAAEAFAAGQQSTFKAHFTERSRAMLGLVVSSRMDSSKEAPRGGPPVTIKRERSMNHGHLNQQRILVEIIAGGAESALVLHDVGGAWRIDLIDTERALTGLSRPF